MYTVQVAIYTYLKIVVVAMECGFVCRVCKHVLVCCKQETVSIDMLWVVVSFKAPPLCH